jgi:hypothetical protein
MRIVEKTSKWNWSCTVPRQPKSAVELVTESVIDAEQMGAFSQASNDKKVPFAGLLLQKACTASTGILVGLGLLAALSVPAIGQEAQAVHVGSVKITGIPEDWTNRHVVFSNPGTEQEATSAGRHDHWQKIVDDPRYVMQQLRRNLEVQGPVAVDATYRAEEESEAYGNGGTQLVTREDVVEPGGARWGVPQPVSPWRKGNPPVPRIHRDWSQPLGGNGLAAGQYPAKYSFSTTSASCSDYVVYPTGAAGTTSQATVVAFTNIYVGTGACAATNPTVYWAFNTPPGGTVGNSATATLSPVLSLDGSQVAFVETYSSTGYLVILKMAAETISAYNAPSAALTYQTLANYRACTAPCYTTVSLGAADTSSAPYYNYSGVDTIYVGDDTGKVHEVAGAFSGTPALDGVTGWPVTASTETSHALNSPIFDNISGNIFVGDSGGYLHQFAVSTPGTVYASNRLENNTVGVFDSPLVDSTTELVWAFIGYSGDTANNNPSYVNRFTANASISATYGTGLPFGNGNASHSTNPTTTIMRAGAFDYLYALNNGTSGNLYSCSNGHVFQITITGTTTLPTVPNAFNTPVSALASCSPMTEILAVKVSTKLTSALTAAATSVPVTATTGMASGDYIQVDSEIMKISTLANPLTVTRGALGTTAATHSNSATVQDIQDWLFMSVVASGNGTGCTGACVYNYNIIAGAATGTTVAGIAAAGGTSGIVIDNQVPPGTQIGAEQIYYTTLTGETAVQASQAALQ